MFFLFAQQAAGEPVGVGAAYWIGLLLGFLIGLFLVASLAGVVLLTACWLYNQFVGARSRNAISLPEFGTAVKICVGAGLLNTLAFFVVLYVLLGSTTGKNDLSPAALQLICMPIGLLIMAVLIAKYARATIVQGAMVSVLYNVMCFGILVVPFAAMNNGRLPQFGGPAAGVPPAPGGGVPVAGGLPGMGNTARSGPPPGMPAVPPPPVLVPAAASPPDPVPVSAEFKRERRAPGVREMPRPPTDVASLFPPTMRDRVAGNRPSPPRVDTPPAKSPDPPAATGEELANLDRDYRTWNDRSGRFSVEAQFLGQGGGMVALRKRDGTIKWVQAEILSEADQDYLTSQPAVAAPAAAPAEKTSRKPSRHMPGMPGMPAKTQDSELAGGRGGGGWEFRLLDPAHRPLRGISYKLGGWGGQQTVGTLTAIYDAQAPGDGDPAVVARDGYAVGGLQVDADLYVNAMQVIFMRLKPGGRLDPSDRYASDWIGFPTKRPRQQTLASQGAAILGVYGRHGAILNAVGLVFADK